MIRADGLISMLKELQEQQQIKGSCDAEIFCKELGVDQNELVYLFSVLMLKQMSINAKLKEKNLQLSETMAVYRDSLESLHGVSGRTKQETLVKNGLPISRNKKKNLNELRLLIKLGNSDKDLMEWYGISKSTLRRWKIQLKEKEKQGIIW